MPALAASNVTVTVEERAIVGRQRRNRVKIAFGDGALTYPAGGVPMPAAANFGLVRNLDYVMLSDADDGSGIVWKYDKENSKLRGYVQGVQVGAAGAGALDDYPASAGVGVDTVSLGLVVAGAGTYRFGAMKELGTADAPAAQTLYGEAIGW